GRLQRSRMPRHVRYSGVLPIFLEASPCFVGRLRIAMNSGLEPRDLLHSAAKHPQDRTLPFRRLLPATSFSAPQSHLQSHFRGSGLVRTTTRRPKRRPVMSINFMGSPINWIGVHFAASHTPA